jgi:hypothetical protein
MITEESVKDQPTWLIITQLDANRSLRPGYVNYHDPRYLEITDQQISILKNELIKRRDGLTKAIEGNE